MIDIGTGRIFAGFAILAAPAIIALGALGMADAKADTTVATHGPSASAPAQHVPQPGTAAHHHHQRNR